jgi:hypothetical protein
MSPFSFGKPMMGVGENISLIKGIDTSSVGHGVLSDEQQIKKIEF